MAKRFTDSNKYKKAFFRSLRGPYKLLWDFLYHECDHAGIWNVDFQIAQIYLGQDMPVNPQEALNFFNSDEVRVVPFDRGTKWFLPGFIEFQYGKLNPANRAHSAAISILKKYSLEEKTKKITKLLGSPMEAPSNGAKDKEKDKEKDKDKVKVKDKEEEVEEEKKQPDVKKTKLSVHSQEAVERNQFTHTRSNNSDFIKEQWDTFLLERLSDPAHANHEPGELNRYFVNWMRNKFPKNGTDTRNPKKRISGFNSREEFGQL